MTAPPFRYIERRPSEGIAEWVLSLWCFQADAVPPMDPPFTVWPDGCASVGLSRAAGGPAFVVCTGPRVTAMTPPIRPQSQLWGFRLWPDGVAPVLGVPARSLRDAVGLLPAAVAARFEGLARALPDSTDADVVFPRLDDFLREHLVGTPSPDPRIRRAITAIVEARGEVAMRDVARTAGLGLRHLQRRFPEATGLTLREWARVRRLREALARRLASPGSGWSRVAADSGFVDQAHLTREFVALTGLSPGSATRMLQATAHRDVTP